MKSKRTPPPKPEFEELIPLLISLWRKLHKLPPGPADQLQTREFRSAIDALLRLHKENDLNDKDLLGAYLLYDWIMHYLEGLSLLQELPEPPNRVLDLCSGSAPFGLAAAKHGAKEVLALDINPQVLKFATEICGRMGHTISIREHDCLNLKFPIEGKWDLIIIGYALSELFNTTQEKERYVQSLFGRLSENGHILIIESSKTDENRRLLSLRDALVEKGIKVQAPCIWRGACPALKHSSSQCYAQRPFEKPPFIKNVQRAAEINLSSLKMSYLLLKHPLAPWPQVHDKPVYRVVSPPIETFRGERYFLCGTEGKKTLGSRLETHPKHSKAFEYLQRGDLISIEKPLEIKDDYEITEETEVKLEVPCGKPVKS